MERTHGGTTEARGWALIAALETFRGCSLKFANKQSGFNGLSVSQGGEKRKIELKTVERSDNWFAINGMEGIKKLFFDDEYWLYFSLIPEKIVVAVKALPFMKSQLKYRGGKNLLESLKVWIDQTESLTKNYGLQFIPRINFKVKTPIRQMVKQIQGNSRDNEWCSMSVSIWQLGDDGYWVNLLDNHVK